MRVTFRISTLFAVTAMIACGNAAERVSGEEGNIVMKDSSGHMTLLTHGGNDTDPWLSPDGHTVVFIRHSAQDIFRTLVYALDVQTRTLVLLYRGPAKYAGRTSSYFGRPELNEGHDTLFLIAKEYATEGSLVAVRLHNGEARLVTNHVVGYDVIQCSPHLGELIVLKRQTDIFDHPYHLYWLYSPLGRNLGLAGAEELDVEALRYGDCEQSQSTPAAPHPRVGASDSNEIDVESGVMEPRLVHRVEPTYPAEAISAHTEGDVRFRVRIGIDGTVQDLNLISGPPQLVEAAILALKQWRYRPATRSGRPVPVVTVVDVPFRLPSSAK